MSDLLYFQGLYATALDFTMKAYYASLIRALNAGVLGVCVHSRSVYMSSMSYGTHYSFWQCNDCGTQFDHKGQEAW